MLELRS